MAEQSQRGWAKLMSAMAARPFGMGFAIGGVIGCFIGTIVGARVIIRRTADEVTLHSEAHLRRLLEEQFQGNIDNMLNRSAELARKDKTDRTERDLLTTIDMFVTPYTRVTIFNKDYAVFSGRSKACIVPMDTFKVVKKHRETVLQQHGLLDCARKHAADGDTAYRRASVIATFDACLPDRSRRE